jgi:hypothetical protein
MADDIKRAEQRGYAKGYAAGKRRQGRTKSDRFDGFLCAAITGLLASPNRWGPADGSRLDCTPDEYAATAASIARALMKKQP